MMFGCSAPAPDMSQEKILCGTRRPSCQDSTRSIPEILPAMAGPLEEMCALPRRLL